MKAESHDRHLRQLLTASPHELLTDIRVIMQVTVDTDAIAIFLASTATMTRRACETLRPEAAFHTAMTQNCQTLLALEATVGPKGASQKEHLVCAPTTLYTAICKRMGITNDPFAAEIAIAALLAVWALSGCDFCLYRYGRLSVFTDELCKYISAHGTGPFSGIVHHKTAKDASAALLAVWRMAVTTYSVMINIDGAKRHRGEAPPPTDDQLSHAIWASLYWRNEHPPDDDAESWGFYGSGVTSETTKPRVHVLCSVSDPVQNQDQDAHATSVSGAVSDTSSLDASYK